MNKSYGSKTVKPVPTMRGLFCTIFCAGDHEIVRNTYAAAFHNERTLFGSGRAQ